MECEVRETTQTVALKLAAILTEYLSSNPGNMTLGQHAIGPETDLVTDLQLDSFQVMEFMLEVEDHYDVAIDMVSLANIHSITDLAGVVLTAQAE